MVDKKDKKKKAKKTVTQKQKQKQSVVVNVNMSKPATRRRTLAKKTHDNRPLPPTPQAYGIPVQQSVQPSLNNITEYLKQKEGQENNRHVNILSAMKAIQRDEGQQGGRVQTERVAGSSTKAPPAEAPTTEEGGAEGLKKERRKKTQEEKDEAKRVRDLKAAMRVQEEQKAMEQKGGFAALNQPTAASEPKPGYKAGPTSDFTGRTPPN